MARNRYAGKTYGTSKTAQYYKKNKAARDKNVNTIRNTISSRGEEKLRLYLKLLEEKTVLMVTET